MTTMLNAQPRTFIGYAYDIKTQKLLYTENHAMYYNNGNIVKSVLVYKDPSGNKIAERISDYSKFPQVPLFETTDLRRNYKEGSTYEGNGVIVYHVENNKKNTSKLFPINPQVALDSGFHFFVITHFDSLLKGNKLKVNFIVPSQLNMFEFVVYKTKELMFENRKCVQLIFEINNLVIKFFVPPIYLVYDIETKDLMQYTGISNLYDDNNKAYNVNIIFKY